jgi:hypothetical protein
MDKSIALPPSLSGWDWDSRVPNSWGSQIASTFEIQCLGLNSIDKSPLVLYLIMVKLFPEMNRATVSYIVLPKGLVPEGPASENAKIQISMTPQLFEWYM